MDKAEVMKIIDDHDHLAHYRTKGSKNGVRRYQYEDGSLTPEGYRHYGLNPRYSSMTTEDLNRAIKRKQTENQYVSEMTKDVRKKREDLKGFVKAASDTAGKGGELANKTLFAKDQRDIIEYKQDLTAEKKKLVDDMNAKGVSEAQKKALSKQIADKQAEIDAAEEARKLHKNVGDTIPQIARAPGQYSEQIANVATKGELQKLTADAYRRAQEMDDETLEKVFNRMKLEKQYDELVNPPKPSTYERGREVLQTLGTVLSIGLTAVSIYSMLKGRGGGDDKKAKQSDLDDGSEFLAHYRTKGSKNGVRRYQNEDGSLTPEGYRHYGIDPNGRPAADPRAAIERQRMMQRAAVEKQRSQMAAQRDRLKIQSKQNAYTQKIQQREAIREARNQAHLDQIYAKQRLEEQRMQNQEELRVQAESRANMRKNIIKGVLGVAAIGAAVGVGYHFLHNRSLDLRSTREIDKINAEHKNDVDKVMKEAKAKQLTDKDLLKERNRHLEEMQNIKNRGKQKDTELRLNAVTQIANNNKTGNTSSNPISISQTGARKNVVKFKYGGLSRRGANAIKQILKIK